MTIHLPEDLEKSIRAEVSSGHFPSVDDAVAAALRAFLDQRNLERAGEQASGQENSGSKHKPIWEEILELTADVPDEEWDKLPVYGAEQHDHYIYGTPKRVDAAAESPAQPTEASERIPIWDVIDTLRKSVPPEEFSKLPKDGAEQLDHYLYGSPKRPNA